MASSAWKQLERDTASYFGTRRRLRGDDFSRSDVEVLVDVEGWLKDGRPPKKYYLVIECKYSKEHGIVQLFNKAQLNVSNVLILRLGDYILVKLDNFIDLYKDFIDIDHSTSIPGHRELLLEYISSKYTISQSNRRCPQYLDSYVEQARKYIPKLTMATAKVLPLLSLAKANTKGRVIAVHVEDVAKYIPLQGSGALMP
jgi:hypothetical protein